MTAGTEAGGMLPELPLRSEFSLVIPTNEQFLQLRAEAKQAGKLPNLRQMVAAWQDVADRCHLAFEELTRIAVFKLEVERELGAHLAQTVHRGGSRSKYSRSTLLPDDLTRNQSSAYQALAAIPEATFRAYLQGAHRDEEVPSSRGARAFAAATRSRGQQSVRRTTAAGHSVISEAVLDAMTRIMTPDVVVGCKRLKAKWHFHPDASNVLDMLTGDVFVAQCPQPQLWLPAIERLRKTARVYQAVVVLPAEVWTDWFAAMEVGDWLCCFLKGARGSDGNGVMLAHVGAKQGAFRLAFRHLGVVMGAIAIG